MRIADTTTLGEMVRKRRKELKYTQVYLSEVTGLSITFISDLERGKASIHLEKAIQVIHVLGMDLFVEKRG